MKRATLFLLCGAVIALPIQLSAQAAAGAKPAAPAAASAKGRVVEIEATEAMKFSVTQITAKPGEDLVVRLKILGKMPKGAMDHNFVLLKEGVNATTFANEAMMAGPSYIPAARKGDVLVMSPLGSGGQTVETPAFKAPTKPGTYTFICSFPGHFAAGMRGTLVVK